MGIKDLSLSEIRSRQLGRKALSQFQKLPDKFSNIVFGSFLSFQIILNLGFFDS